MVSNISHWLQSSLTAGKHLILAFQTSNTITRIPIDKQGRLNSPSVSLSTLPHSGSTSHALSDIHLSPKNLIYTLNRRVSPPYLTSGDTVSLFRLDGEEKIIPVGTVQLPCFQPREILALSEETVAITCVGVGGDKAGVVVLHQEYVVDYWSAQSAWGIALA